MINTRRITPAGRNRTGHNIHAALLRKLERRNRPRILALAYLNWAPIALLLQLLTVVPNPAFGAQLQNAICPTLDYNRFLGDAFPNTFVFADVEDIDMLVRGLGLNPGQKQTFMGYTCTNRDAMCIYLARLRHPGNLRDIAVLLGPGAGSPARISTIFTEFGMWLYQHHKHRVAWSHACCTQQRMAKNAAAATAKGSLFNNLVGFVDGTVHPVARPDSNQRAVYNGVGSGVR